MVNCLEQRYEYKFKLGKYITEYNLVFKYLLERGESNIE